MGRTVFQFGQIFLLFLLGGGRYLFFNFDNWAFLLFLFLLVKIIGWLSNGGIWKTIQNDLLLRTSLEDLYCLGLYGCLIGQSESENELKTFLNIRSDYKYRSVCLIIFDLGARCYSKIGFVGLGNMGGHMARNLLTKVRREFGKHYETFSDV